MATRSDAPQTIHELRAWNTKHAAHLNEWEMQQIDRRWRSIGKLAHQVGGLNSVKNYN